VYLAAIVLVWHVGTVGKGNWPFARKVFVPLLVLQLLRLMKPLVGRTRLKPVSPREPDQLNPGSSASPP
jgi:hypothetical protein